VIIIGNVFSMGCSVHPSARLRRFSDARPEWDTLLGAKKEDGWVPHTLVRIAEQDAQGFAAIERLLREGMASESDK
jgi:hypothetical protein